MEQLRTSGVDFEFLLIENLSNVDARRLYEKADLAIDQLLAGFYGAMSVELMALEVPVICYLRDADLERLPTGMREELPLINATPATLREVLRDWLTTQRVNLRARGQLSRAFVKRWHGPQQIARETLRDYEIAWARKHRREG